ncbi:MAG TPA: S1 RNA-binding domain-containing protein [Myxococcales bacterium]|nr:S1 RNA-binding domain-containing protein [Myxococcales bacterium]
MAEQGGRDRRGKRPPPKTFGDARLGIPAGTRRPEDGGPAPKGEAAGPAKEEPRKGPIVERRGGGLAVRRQPEAETPPIAPQGEAEAPPSARVFRAAKKDEAKPEPPPAPVVPEPVETESFADMFARSERGRQSFSPGQRVRGKIIQLGRETAVLDLGGKAEALMEGRELRGEDGGPLHQVGETLEAYVRSVDDGVWLTLTIPKGARREALQAARESGLPVEGTVTAVNKGGLEVDLGGGTRAFCPASQADVRFTHDLSAFVGQKLKFLVSEMKDRDVVLSRRAYLAREAAERAETLRGSLEVGAQLEGKVVSLRDFGAFVDLGGLEGLIPISELSHRHVAHPSDVLQVGQTVSVEVTRVEPGKDGKERIALSLKALEGDPWESQGNALVDGQRLAGKVVRLQPFGAFVELLPGVDGLLHVSRLATPSGGRVAHPKDVLQEGQPIWVEIESIDRAARKISLRQITEEEAALPPPPRGAGPRVGDVVEATVDKVETFGLFVRWPGGRGLVPISELGLPHGADLRRNFVAGAKLKAAIVEIDAQGRLRLSKTAAEQAEERAEVAQYLNANQPRGKGLGTLADLLKGRKV